MAETAARYSDVDVRVAVASCISEITRITTPDAPYDDDQMKQRKGVDDKDSDESLVGSRIRVWWPKDQM
ncbi:hypothetical protein PanWU01x14_032410 [Parasponia andersonii]|uniref:Uncharacterized protein n=1 Tax=Parasponia andersonii TaxID=3476 RepID=A0A2P5DUE7_PARAD|nr:hypothetical protein PanWU01x14_032410 [Parasponia andersonii]